MSEEWFFFSRFHLPSRVVLDEFFWVSTTPFVVPFHGYAETQSL